MLCTISYLTVYWRIILKYLQYIKRLATRCLAFAFFPIDEQLSLTWDGWSRDKQAALQVFPNSSRSRVLKQTADGPGQNMRHTTESFRIFNFSLGVAERLNEDKRVNNYHGCHGTIFALFRVRASKNRDTILWQYSNSFTMYEDVKIAGCFLKFWICQDLLPWKKKKKTRPAWHGQKQNQN